MESQAPANLQDSNAHSSIIPSMGIDILCMPYSSSCNRLPFPAKVPCCLQAVSAWNENQEDTAPAQQSRSEGRLESFESLALALSMLWEAQAEQTERLLALQADLLELIQRRCTFVITPGSLHSFPTIHLAGSKYP